jgi:hypothetical protein
MILITMILITMDFMVPGGGTVGAVVGAGDPVVGTIEVEGVTEGEGDIGLMVVDLVVEEVDLVEEVGLVEEVEEVVEVEDLVEEVEEVEAEAVVEVEEEVGVVVNHTSMIFLTYSQRLCTCQYVCSNERSFGFPALMRGPSDSHTSACANA